jgi:hypothetical protein
VLGVLAAVLLNAGVCVAATALLYGPALLLPRRAYTIHHVAAVGLGSFSVVAFVTYCVGRAGGNVRASLSAKGAN